MTLNKPYTLNTTTPTDSLDSPSHSDQHNETKRLADEINSTGLVEGYNVDDYVSPQAAIDACGQAGGGTVYFPPGDYSVNLSVNYDNVILQGSGTSTKFTSASGSRIIIFNEVTQCGARDMHLDGEWTPGAVGIGLWGVTRSRFDNIIGKQFASNDPMLDLVATTGNNCSMNTFTHIHCTENTIGFIRFNGGQLDYVTLNTFTSVSAVITNNSQVPAINFLQGADNNRFTGVTRLHLNGGAAATIGVAYNALDLANNEVYENHFDDLMIDNDGSANIPLQINQCENWGYSQIHYRPGGTQGEGAGNNIAANSYAHVFTEGVGGDGSILQVVSITQANYDLLSPPDPQTLYVII